MPENAKNKFDDKYLVAALAAVSALVTLAVYLPALKNGFVGWDDPGIIYNNVRIRSLDLGFFKWVLTATPNANWNPLTMVSHAVDYAIWGLDPLGHHLTSIAVHALSTGLVFIVAVRLVALARMGQGGGSRGLPAADGTALITGLTAALLFGLHPLHVESVVWLSERTDVLSALFFLLSLLAYLKYVAAGRAGSPRWLSYGASLFLFTLALLSKSMALTLPVVLLIIDFYPLKTDESPGGRRGAIIRAVVEKIPFFALSAATAVATILAKKMGGVMAAIDALTFAERVAVAVRGYGFYVFKTLVPVRLAPLYPMPVKGEFFDLWFFASLALIVAITALCVYAAVRAARRRRIFLAVWLYFALTLLPVIGLVQVGAQSAADRYMYLPSVGPFILAGIGAALLAGPVGGRRRTAVTCVVVIVMALLAGLTVRQSGIWKDTITLWSHEIALYPNRVSAAYNNRGLAYEGQGELEKALMDYNTAIRIWPNKPLPYASRGKLYIKTGDLRRALNDYDTAIRLDPTEQSFYYNRGLAYARGRMTSRAVEDFTRAIEIDPGYAMAYYNRARAYSELGMADKTIKDLTAAIGIYPGYANAYHNRGVAYANRGEFASAVEDFSRAIAIRPGDADFYRNRGMAYMRLGEKELASRDLRTAERLKGSGP